jgi:hypothetical protein
MYVKPCTRYTEKYIYNSECFRIWYYYTYTEVDTVARLRAGQCGVWLLTGEWDFSSKTSTLILGFTQAVVAGGFYLADKVARVWGWPFFPLSAKYMNGRSYTSTYPIFLHGVYRYKLPLPLVLNTAANWNFWWKFTERLQFRISKMSFCRCRCRYWFVDGRTDMTSP